MSLLFQEDADNSPLGDLLISLNKVKKKNKNPEFISIDTEKDM